MIVADFNQISLLLWLAIAERNILWQMYCHNKLLPIFSLGTHFV